MNYSTIKNIIIVSGLLSAVSSCNIIHTYKRPDDLKINKLYRGASASDTVSIAGVPWRELFTDKILQSHIEKALQENYDLKIAQARMQSAGASLQQSKLAFLPTLAANAQLTRSKNSSAQLKANGVGTAGISANTLYSLVGSSSWELDIWGKLSSSKRSHVASYLQSDAYRKAVQTQMIASIASNYYQLLAYDQQIHIVEETVQNRKKDVEIVKALKAGAAVTGADVVNSSANLRAAELQLPDLRQNRRELENSLSIILAQSSDSIARTKFDMQHINIALNTGVSSQLLANRPDVQQAEFSFRSYFELTNVARTYFYPSLTISGSAGWATVNTLQDFFSETFYGSFIGGLTQPIFNQGLNKERLKMAQAAQQEAYFTFQNILLSAAKEVSNALYAYQMALSKQKTRELQVLELQKAAEFTKDLLSYSSSTNYTDVLTAEQNLLAAQLGSVSDKLQQLNAVVELYRALGGGWK